MKAVLDNSKLKKSDIDEIVLAGGSTRIPKKVQALINYYINGKEPERAQPGTAPALTRPWRSARRCRAPC